MASANIVHTSYILSDTGSDDCSCLFSLGVPALAEAILKICLIISNKRKGLSYGVLSEGQHM